MQEFSFSNWLLHEAARGPQDVAMAGHVVTLASGHVTLWNKKGNYLGDLVSDIVFANTTLLPGYKITMFHSNSEKGWGPLLYDVAMELVTLQGGHLVSNTLTQRLEGKSATHGTKGHVGGDSSDDADKVYKFYATNRKDVVKTQPDLSKFISEEELRESSYKFFCIQNNLQLFSNLLK